MYTRKSAIAKYGQIASAESNPIAQLVMLYDGAIRFLRLAAADIEANDLEKKAEHSSRALDIVAYLQSILDFERGREAAEALDRLYLTVSFTALKASASLDPREMRRAADLLVPVRDAWREVPATVLRPAGPSGSDRAQGSQATPQPASPGRAR